MNDSIRPARVVTPGQIILRELEARGWSQQDLATIMGRPEQAISEIVRAKKQITVDTARQLAKAFGTSPDFWLNLENNYQLFQARQGDQESDIERRSRLYNLAPIKELTRRGWIKQTNSVDELEEEYLQFYQVKSIDEQPLIAVRCRISEDRGPEERAIVAWLRRVEQLTVSQTPGRFDKGNLPNLLQILSGMMKQETDLQKLPGILLDYGFYFVIVPHLMKSYLDGVAFWTNQHPVIALTLRYDRLDSFWFTLLHEIGHIYLDHQQLHVDQLFGHESNSSEEDEIQANKFATQWLLPPNELAEFIDWNKPRYSREQVLNFADIINRHPGIVVGQLMYKGELKYSQLREYLVKASPYLARWIDVPSLVS